MRGRLLRYGIIAIFLVWVGLISYKVINNQMYIWLPSYISWVLSQKDVVVKPVHIIFFTVDHFEPGKDPQIVKEWLRRYEEVAVNHKDSDGFLPQHTWFYRCKPPVRKDILSLLSQACKEGLGEIELHLHHEQEYDTEETLRQKLQEIKKVANEIGVFITIDDKRRFGFIHGLSSLDNSVGTACCGINNELKILSQEGCYADFTFPSPGGFDQPRKINTIYYSVDDPEKPKSYDNGVDVEVGKPASGDLMIFEGPLTVNWRDWGHIFYPRIEDGQIQGQPFGYEVTPNRIDEWVRTAIRIKGQDNWVFIKTHTHGATRGDKTLFEEMERMFSYLESRYNDGHNFVLHYVTAREAYNLVKAAEAGKTGDPNLYRNYLIKPYRNISTARGR